MDKLNYKGPTAPKMFATLSESVVYSRKHDVINDAKSVEKEN